MEYDLISREELIKKITEQYDMQYGDYPLSNIIDCIQNQPSAKKQDEIIEQLEKCRDIMLSPVTQDCFGEECRYNDCMACVFAKAIEIVKRGVYKMERLTKPGVDEYVKCNINNACTGMCGSCPRNTEIRRKLKYYEDLEEQGKLVF